MNVRKMPNGRWQARLKQGRADIGTKMFDTRHEAVDWLTRERAALAGGFDRRAGQVTVRKALPMWLEERKATVAPKTYVADAAVGGSPRRHSRPFRSAASPNVRFHERWCRCAVAG